jgi:hydroxymethylbilane synthase
VTFHLATRGSALALWQAETTKALLEAAYPDLDVDLVRVKSSGDERTDVELAKFGRIGIFTVEVDRAVHDGRARSSVHSLKDMTTTLDEGLMLAGTLERGPTEDALVTRTGATLEELPEGARVATGSRRRAAMALAARPDLEIVGIRGNVETRLAKLDTGEADALVMARAGLLRLGLGDRVAQVLDKERFLPAVGQGIVGLVCRRDDDEARAKLFAISDVEAWDEAHAERALLAELRGGCNVPVGGHARVAENALSLRARVLALDGSRAIEGEIGGRRDEAVELGRELARRLIEKGADELIEAARA